MAFYFGYGSNMSPWYFSGLCNITPRLSQANYLNDYVMVVGLVKSDFIELRFGKIKPNKGGWLEGVLHKITERYMAWLMAPGGEDSKVTEASIRFAGETVLAKTLRFKNEMNYDLPVSRRNMQILLKAARKTNLSVCHINALKSKKLYTIDFYRKFLPFAFYLSVKYRAKNQRV